MAFVKSQIPADHPSAGLLGEERFGAGVAIAPDLVLTAHYLVLGAERVELVGPDGRDRTVAQVSLDHETGLCLLRLEGEPLPAAPLGPGVAVPGCPVFLVTWTSEGKRASAFGHVTAVEPFEAFWEYMLDRAILTTIVNPGLAGAPLFDAHGRVLGIVSIGLTSVGRYSLAIPIELFVAQRERLERGESSLARRAWLGLFPQAGADGVSVSGVVNGSPADQAGLARGDLVLSVDGQAVSSVRELYREIWRKAPGQTLRLQVLREREIRAVEVTAGDRYEFYR